MLKVTDYCGICENNDNNHTAGILYSIYTIHTVGTHHYSNHNN